MSVTRNHWPYLSDSLRCPYTPQRQSTVDRRLLSCHLTSTSFFFSLFSFAGLRRHSRFQLQLQGVFSTEFRDRAIVTRWPLSDDHMVLGCRRGKQRDAEPNQCQKYALDQN